MKSRDQKQVSAPDLVVESESALEHQNAPKHTISKRNRDFLMDMEYYRGGRYYGAVRAFEQALRAGAKDPEVRRYLRKSLDLVSRERLYSPKYLTLYDKGISHHTRGEFEEEIFIWKRFLKAYPLPLRVEGYLRESQATLNKIRKSKI